MNAREWERLLGGYAAGTLTSAERNELMRVALEDQQLFDALADEEALRDALADPVFRARLLARMAPLAAMDVEPALFAREILHPAAVVMRKEAPAPAPAAQRPPEKTRNLRWMWWLAPALAAGLALIFVVKRHEEKQPVELAAVRQAGPQADEAAPAMPPAAPPVAKRPEAASKPRPESNPKPTPAPPPAEVRQMTDAPVRQAELADKGALAGKAEQANQEEKAKSLARSEPRKADAALDAAASAALELQVERRVAGRFEAVELGALKKGDRVRFRVRPPEAGRLTMAVGSAPAQSITVLPGRTYYLPGVDGMAPGDEPVDVAIAVTPAAGEGAQNLFRARDQAQAQAASGVVGGAPGAMAPSAPAPAASAKEASADAAKPSNTPGREVRLRLRLEFKPR